MSAQNVMATYDIWSETYDETANPLIPIEEMAVRSLLRTIEYHDVLDVATGTGRHAIYFAEQGKRVSATDCNKKMLAKARAKARQQQLSIEFRLEDVCDISFEDGSFDLVICALALAHVESLTKPCQEFMRVLRSDGHLIITDLHPFVQDEIGPDNWCELIEGHGPVFFPNYHSQVDDYLEAMELVGAEVMAALDIPMKLTGELFPGALIIWAKKSRERI
jgi:ubiquinone/menaquinone biosynthesis C-methylase UbiE